VQCWSEPLVPGQLKNSTGRAKIKKPWRRGEKDTPCDSLVYALPLVNNRLTIYW
jgi:hypothetical protein